MLFSWFFSFQQLYLNCSMLSISLCPHREWTWGLTAVVCFWHDALKKDIGMIGAIAGDIIGSIYEWNNIKTKNFTLFSGRSVFTDDSVLTIALADTILTGRPYAENLKAFFQWYPHAGYGGSFSRWAQERTRIHRGYTKERRPYLNPQDRDVKPPDKFIQENIHWETWRTLNVRALLKDMGQDD